jgi:hypothetical protein
LYSYSALHVSGTLAPIIRSLIILHIQPPVTVCRWVGCIFQLWCVTTVASAALRHCARSRTVAGSIPDGVSGIFHWHNPSGHTLALGSIQLVTEMSTRNIFRGVKAAGAQGWQPYQFYVPIVLKSESLNFLEPSGPVQACNEIALPLPLPYTDAVVGLFLYNLCLDNFFFIIMIFISPHTWWEDEGHRDKRSVSSVNLHQLTDQWLMLTRRSLGNSFKIHIVI